MTFTDDEKLEMIGNRREPLERQKYAAQLDLSTAKAQDLDTAEPEKRLKDAEAGLKALDKEASALKQ